MSVNGGQSFVATMILPLLYRRRPIPTATVYEPFKYVSNNNNVDSDNRLPLEELAYFWKFVVPRIQELFRKLHSSS